MKFVFSALIIFVLYALFAYGRLYYFSHYSQNPNIIQSDLNLGSGTPLRYVAAGDSTAVGVGASSVEKTYPYQLASYLARNHSVIYKNVAVSGAKTGDVISSQLSQIVAFHPDVVTISIGANDTTHLMDGDKILENYQTILRILDEQTTAKIYVTNIPNFAGASILPSWYIRILEWHSSKLNPRIAQLETDRVKIVNIHDFGWDQFPERGVTYSSDHFHPSDMGYKNWANAFLSKIK